MFKNLIIISLILIISITVLIAESPTWEQIEGTQYSMTLHARITLDETTFSGDGNNIAAAFGPGGESDCRSIGIWATPNPPYENYWYFTIVGNINFEEISFRIYDENSDSTLESLYTITFENGSTLGSATEPELIEFFNPLQPLPSPQNVKITLYPETNFVYLSWDEVAGAGSYVVYASDTPDVADSGVVVGRVSEADWVGVGIANTKKFYAVTSSTENLTESAEEKSYPKEIKSILDK